jgi:hypothetical protein
MVFCWLFWKNGKKSYNEHVSMNDLFLSEGGYVYGKNHLSLVWNPLSNLSEEL